MQNKALILSSIIFIIFYLYRKNFFKKFNNSNNPNNSSNLNSLLWINTPHPSGKYGSFNPAERYPDLIKKFGEPDLIDKNPGGVAIWKRSTLRERGHCWERVEIHDEQIPHTKPAPHTDFLYTWYRLDVPDDKVTDVLSLSESVTYDPLKRVVRARCHFTGANNATLVLAKKIATGEITLQQAKTSYGPYIMATAPTSATYDPKAEESYVKELCDYLLKV